MLLTLSFIFLLTQGGNIRYGAYSNGSCDQTNHKIEDLTANQCKGSYYPRCKTADSVTMEYYQPGSSCRVPFGPVKAMELKNGQCKYHDQLRKYLKVTFTNANACGHMRSTSNKSSTSGASSGSGVAIYRKGSTCKKENIITDLKECENAIKAAGKRITRKWTGNTPTIPYGCSLRETDGNLHFNSNSANKGRNDLSPVCRKNTGTTTTTTAAVPQYELHASKYECNGAQVAKGNVSNNEAGVKECAKKCQTISNWFTVGTNSYGTKKCNSSGCPCVCETASATAHTCRKVRNNGVRLYRYKRGNTATLVARKKECQGGETYKGRVSRGSSVNLCRDRCKYISSMFVVETGCPSYGCKCYCETAGRNGHCTQKVSPKYDLYKYTASIDTEVSVGKDCNEECSGLHSQDLEDCIEHCWDNSEVDIGGEECYESESGLWGMKINFGAMEIKSIKKKGVANSQGLSKGMKIVSYNDGLTLKTKKSVKAFKKQFKLKKVTKLCFVTEEEPSEEVLPSEDLESEEKNSEDLESEEKNSEDLEPEEELPGRCDSTKTPDLCTMEDKKSCEGFAKRKIFGGYDYPCKWKIIGTCTSYTHSIQCGSFTDEMENCEQFTSTNAFGEVTNPCKFNIGEKVEGCKGVNQKPCIFPFVDPIDGQTYDQCKATGDSTERRYCATNTNPDTIELSNCDMNVCTVTEELALGNGMSGVENVGYVLLLIVISMGVFFAGKYVGDKQNQSNYVKASSVLVELE